MMMMMMMMIMMLMMMMMKMMDPTKGGKTKGKERCPSVSVRPAVASGPLIFRADMINSAGRRKNGRAKLFRPYICGAWWLTSAAPLMLWLFSSLRIPQLAPVQFCSPRTLESSPYSRNYLDSHNSLARQTDSITFSWMIRCGRWRSRQTPAEPG